MEGDFSFSLEGYPYSYSNPKFKWANEYRNGVVIGLFQ